MESKVSPNSIQDRADELATKTAEADKAVADKATEEATVKAAADKIAADAAAKAEADKLAAEKGKGDPNPKPDNKVEPDKKLPNDPVELRKWSTKVSQDNAALRDEIRALKAAVEKMAKKPIDYKELAKNPDALKGHIEAERAEAAAELQEQLEEKTHELVKSETVIERMRCEQDTENFPRWKELFPLIQNLASNVDGRINFNRAPAEVLPDLYRLADQMVPKAAPVAPVAPVAPAAPAVPPVKTYSEAEVEAIKKEAFEKAQQALKDEVNGAGIGSAGKGGRRSSGVSKDALQTMPLKDLKALISQE